MSRERADRKISYPSEFKVGRKPKDTPQWRAVHVAREVLNNSEGKPVLEELENAWALLEMEYGTVEVFGREEKVVDRDSVGMLADNPLVALFYCVHSGFYPPPELLLGLSFLWDEYLDAAGGKTLEEVFIGKPKRKAGNYASRDNSKMTKMMRAMRFQRFLDDGLTQEQAAEKLIGTDNLDIDAETIIREARKDALFRQRQKTRKNKRVINPVKPQF